MTQCTSFCLLYDCNMILVMGRYENLRELSVNVISPLAFCVKHELREWQICLILAILSEFLRDFM